MGKIMKKEKNRRKMNRVFRCLAAAWVVLFVFFSGGNVLAKDGDLLRSTTDYLNALADQAADVESTRFYKVTDISLAKKLLKPDWSAFSDHYDPEQPLRSGCYLVYYLDSVSAGYTGASFKASLIFKFSESAIREHFQFMDKLAGELKGKSEFDTVKNVHDYLADHFEYDMRKEQGNHTDLEGFRDGKTVCSGYGIAAYYLLNKAGVKTRVITGIGGSSTDQENHLWNIVCVDGKWYNMDVTWDDEGNGKKNYDYFLKSDAEFPSHYRTGVYDSSEFKDMLSKESYPLPVPFMDTMAFRVGILVVGFFILFLIVISQKKKQQEQQRVEMELQRLRSVNVWNPDDPSGYVPMGTGRNDGSGMNYGQEDGYSQGYGYNPGGYMAGPGGAGGFGTGGYGAGGYGQGQNGAGGYGAGGYGPGQNGTGGYGAGGYGPGQNGTGGYGAGGYGPGQNGVGGYGTGQNGAGGYNPGGYMPGQNGAGGYNPGGYDPGEHEGSENDPLT